MWVCLGPLQPLAIPTSLHASLLARLDPVRRPMRFIPSDTLSCRTHPIPVYCARPARNCKLRDLLRERKRVTSVEYSGRNPNILISTCAWRALVTNVEHGDRNPNITISMCASRRGRATGRACASIHSARTACTVHPHAAARGHAASRVHRRSARY